MKLVLNDIVSRYGSVDALNENFSKIEQAVNNSLSRDGEGPNDMRAPLDMNHYNIINGGTAYVGSLVINGVEVEVTDTLSSGSAFQRYQFAAADGQTTFDLAPATPSLASTEVYVNGLALPPSDIGVSGTTVLIPPMAEGAEVVVQRYTRDPVAIPDAGALTFLQLGTGAVNRVVQDKLRESISVEDFGAKGDGVTDDTAAIQAAINANSVINFSKPVYKITAPLYVPTNKILVGKGVASTRIFKQGNALGTGSNVMGGQTDSYAKDAVVILTHADNTYNSYTKIANIYIDGSVSSNDYGVYAPRLSLCEFADVLVAVGAGLYGWTTHDTFMTRFNGVQVAKSFTARAGSIGFWWDDLADGSSGTSCNFTNCWARDGFDIGWKIRGLTYSTLSSCGSDRYVTNALNVDLCDLTIDSFGFENRLSGNSGSPIFSRYSRINAQTLLGFSVDVGAGFYLVDHQGGSFSLGSIRHTSLTTSAGSIFRVADNGTFVVTGGTPTGAGIVTTPVVDATSKYINLTTFPSAYMEGTWTPVITGATTAGTYELSTASGRYTRVGNQVTLQCHMVLAGTITGGGAGGIRITGLPFAKGNNTTIPTGAIQLQGVNFTAGTSPFVAFVASGASSTLFIGLNTVNSAVGQIQVGDLATNDILSFTLTYSV